jgi:hypothetical protein
MHRDVACGHRGCVVTGDEASCQRPFNEDHDLPDKIVRVIGMRATIDDFEAWEWVEKDN